MPNPHSHYLQKTQKRFSKFAPFYDLMTEILIFGLRKKIIKYFDLPPGSKILDAPCGTGAFSILLAKRGYRIYGVDISPEMLDRGRMKDKEKKIKFFLSDTAHLPFKNNFFDGAIISLGIHEMSYRVGGETLLEVKRCVRPGGQIIIFDLARPENRLINFLAYNFLKILEEKEYRDYMKILIEPYLRETKISIIKKIVKFYFGFLQVTLIENKK